MTLQIVIAPELAPHLAKALSKHIEWCRTNGISVADGLVEARDWSQVVARGLSSPDPLPTSDTDDVEPLILTIPQTAQLLGCGVTKVKTLVDTGQLPAVDFGGVRRIRRADVDALLERLAVGSSFRERVQTKSDPAAANGRPGRAKGVDATDGHEAAPPSDERKLA